MGQAARLDLVRLVDEVALGDQHDPVLPRHRLEHLGDVRAAAAPAPRAVSPAISTSSAMTDVGRPAAARIIAASTIEIANDFTP